MLNFIDQNSTDFIYPAYLTMKYPFIAPRNSTGGMICPFGDYRWCTYFDDVPPGWGKLFIDLCDEICRYFDDNDVDVEIQKDFYFTDVKEKYGSLCVYTTPIDTRYYDDIMNILDKYEQLSKNVCRRCGAAATKMTTGWIGYYCDDCAPENAVERS